MINQFVLAAGCAREQAKQLLQAAHWQFEVRKQDGRRARERERERCVCVCVRRVGERERRRGARAREKQDERECRSLRALSVYIHAHTRTHTRRHNTLSPGRRYVNKADENGRSPTALRYLTRAVFSTPPVPRRAPIRCRSAADTRRIDLGERHRRRRRRLPLSIARARGRATCSPRLGSFHS